MVKNITTLFQGGLVDENFEPLAGANVYVTNNTKVGATTTSKGLFIIDDMIINDNTPITISFVGYKTIKGTVKELNNRTIKMEIDENQLPEFIGTGTSTSSKCGWLCWLLIAAGVYGISKMGKKPQKVSI